MAIPGFDALAPTATEVHKLCRRSRRSRITIAGRAMVAIEVPGPNLGPVRSPIRLTPVDQFKPVQLNCAVSAFPAMPAFP